MLCDGHHKLLHRLVDPRVRNVSKATNRRFADVVKMEQAKQALKDLGFKARAARRAVETAFTHVGPDTDVATLVSCVLAMNREAAIDDDDADTATLAKRALASSGYSSAIAAKAVQAAQIHVGRDAALEVILIEAFRRCSSR